jgi:putative ATPase
LNQNIPLAEKLRPKTLEEVLGQEHLTGKNGTIRKMIENDTLKSLIFWGLQEREKLLWQKLSLKIRKEIFKLSAVSMKRGERSD